MQVDTHTLALFNVRSKVTQLTMVYIRRSRPNDKSDIEGSQREGGAWKVNKYLTGSW